MGGDDVEEVMNGIADAYDRVEMNGGPPTVEVVSNDAIMQHTGRGTGSGMVKSAGPAMLMDEVDGEWTMYVNAEHHGAPLTHTGTTFGEKFMPVHMDLSVGRYRAMAAAAQIHFAENVKQGGVVSRVKRALLERSWRKLSGRSGVVGEPAEGVSATARKSPRSMYTEFFTEYVSSKGNTPLEVVQDWADDWGWDATINDVPTAAAQGALVAAAGDDEIDPQWDAEFEADLVEFDDDGYVFTTIGASDDGNDDDHDYRYSVIRFANE